MFQRVQNYRNDIVSVLGNYSEKGIRYLYSEVSIKTNNVISENFACLFVRII